MNSPTSIDSLSDTDRVSFMFPSVSIAIPTYNEKLHIGKLLQCFINSQYPNIIEIIIADGGSSDGTQNIVREFSEKDSRIHLIENPKKIQSHALNLILSECKGDIFLRLDAHSDYATDYVEQCVEALLSSGALNVGGAQRFVARTNFQAGVALASRSILGNGGAKYRNPNYDGYADTVYLGCFWKHGLLAVSGYEIEARVNEDAQVNAKLIYTAYNSEQITNQDARLNAKLRKNYRHPIYVSSRIKVWYYPRDTLSALFLQYLKYGRGRSLNSSKYKSKAPLRSKLPFLVILLFLLLVTLSFVSKWISFLTLAIAILSALILVIETTRVFLRNRSCFFDEIWRGNSSQSPSFSLIWFFCLVSLLTMPIAHFSGYSYQLFRRFILQKKGW